MFYIIATIVCVSYIIYLLRKKYTLNLPGPPGLPILGNWFAISNPKVQLKLLDKYTKKYGKTIKIYGGFDTIVFTSDTALVEKILNSKEFITKSKEYDFFKGWLGNGLFTSTGKEWRSKRKILTPTFHYSILEDFISVFKNHSIMLINNLNEYVGKDSFDILNLISAYTLDVICDSSMGVNINVQSNPDHEFPKAIHEMCKIMFTRRCNPIYRYDLIYKFSNLYKKELELINFLHKFSMKIIENRKQTINIGKKKKTSFLDMLLKNTNLTDKEIREEVDTFLFGGLDTTAIALSFLIFNLANNKDVQDKVVKELIEVLGTNLERTTVQDLNNLKYLEIVIKESIRLYPIGPIMGRLITEDFKHEETTIRKGTSLIINIWSMHRNEEVFSNPLQFDPERFSYENVNKYKPFEYLPFSAGHRNCLGQKFAWLEMKMVIANMLLEYEFKAAIPNFVPQVYPAISLASLNGVKVGLVKRLL